MVQQRLDKRDGLAEPSSNVNEAFRLLEKFLSSGVSLRWRVSSWDGMVSLLLIWGKKSKSRSNKGKLLSKRRKGLSRRKLSGVRKQSDVNAMKIGSADSSLVSSPVDCGFASGDIFTISPLKEPRDYWHAASSGDSVFSIDSVKRRPGNLSVTSSDEVFLYDSSRRRKGGISSPGSRRSLSSSSRHRSSTYMSNEKAYDKDLLNCDRRDNGSQLSGAKEILRRINGNSRHSDVLTPMENEQISSTAGKAEDSIEEYYLVSNLADSQYDRFPTRLGNRKDLATEQLQRLSGEDLVFGSLWREKADIPLVTTKNEIYEVSNYVCDETRQIGGEKRYLKRQLLCSENPTDESVQSPMRAPFYEEENVQAHKTCYIRKWQSNLGNEETSNEACDYLANATWPKHIRKGWSRQICQANKPRLGSCSGDENQDYCTLLDDRHLHVDRQPPRCQSQIHKASLELDNGVTRPLEVSVEKSCVNGMDCSVKDQTSRNAYFEKNDHWEGDSQLVDFRRGMTDHGTLSTVNHDKFCREGNSCDLWAQAYSNADISLSSVKKEIYHRHTPWEMEDNEDIIVNKQFQFEDGLSNCFDDLHRCLFMKTIKRMKHTLGTSMLFSFAHFFQ